MRLAGLSIVDGRMDLLSLHKDGLHLSAIGLDPRGSDDFGTGLTFPSGTLQTIVVVPSPIKLPVDGATFQFTALGYDEFGNSVAVTPVWSIVEGGTSASIVPGTGVITTGASAEAITVRATVGSLTADAEVSIEEITVDSLTVYPGPTFEIPVGGTAQFGAVGVASGEQVAVNPTWSVTGVGSIDSATGLYTAGTVTGTATVTATYGLVTADVTVTVVMGEVVSLFFLEDPPELEGNETTDLTVQGQDIHGNVYDFRVEDYAGSIQWSVTTGGSISAAGPVGTLLAYPVSSPETYIDGITATWNGLSASIGFTVNPIS